jgi:hypothetical protein
MTTCKTETAKQDIMNVINLEKKINYIENYHSLHFYDMIGGNGILRENIKLIILRKAKNQTTEQK